jgi:HTH-type transcriptional regulator, transcriptional repressor of NAD biosynthesis genes
VTFGIGLVIGKFLPPHRGHGLLIETAVAQAERVVVIVCERETDPIPAELRAEWLRELHPAAAVLVVEDRYDERDSAVWADNTVRWLGRAPDVVFTSEDYGERYASLMGARHVAVDPARERVPVSGTAVRSDPFACWDHLDAPVRGYYAKRVCVVGAESTGTTTLARELARELGTCWVEEYGRDYTAAKWARGESAWRTQEFEHIALEQVRRADARAREADRVLVCDTNAFATVLWHRRYVGGPCPGVEAIARRERCDLYLLTGDEIPFVQDGLRDGEHVRHEMHRWFEKALAAQSVPWSTLRGSPDERLRQAVRLVRGLFEDSAWKPRTCGS